MTHDEIEDLVGVDLDRAIAQALGYHVAGQDDEFGLRIQRGTGYVPFSPSSDWGAFGPLMVAYRVDLQSADGNGWLGDGSFFDHHALTAGCRALLHAIKMKELQLA
jgi:hypothetical protein